MLTAGEQINGTCAQASLAPDSAACTKFEHDMSLTGPVWFALQQDLSKLSNDSRWQIVDGAPHNIPIVRPDVVIESLWTLLDLAALYTPAAAAQA